MQSGVCGAPHCAARKGGARPRDRAASHTHSPRTRECLPVPPSPFAVCSAGATVSTRCSAAGNLTASSARPPSLAMSRRRSPARALRTARLPPHHRNARLTGGRRHGDDATAGVRGCGGAAHDPVGRGWVQRHALCLRCAAHASAASPSPRPPCAIGAGGAPGAMPTDARVARLCVRHQAKRAPARRTQWRAFSTRCPGRARMVSPRRARPGTQGRGRAGWL